MTLARTTISIDKATLERFFRAYPPGKRSRIIEGLIQKDLERRQENRANAAELVETHDDFQTVREDGEWWEHASAADGFDSI